MLSQVVVCVAQRKADRCKGGRGGKRRSVRRGVRHVRNMACDFMRRLFFGGGRCELGIVHGHAPLKKFDLPDPLRPTVGGWGRGARVRLLFDGGGSEGGRGYRNRRVDIAAGMGLRTDDVVVGAEGLDIDGVLVCLEATDSDLADIPVGRKRREKKERGAQGGVQGVPVCALREVDV